MKIIILTQLLVLILGSLVVSFYTGAEETRGYAIGAGLILINFVVMGISWGQIFKKKYIALSILAIVSKYAILAAILYYLVKHLRVSLLWFSLGIGSFVMSAVIYALIMAFKNEEEKDGI